MLRAIHRRRGYKEKFPVGTTCFILFSVSVVVSTELLSSCVLTASCRGWGLAISSATVVSFRLGECLTSVSLSQYLLGTEIA